MKFKNNAYLAAFSAVLAASGLQAGAATVAAGDLIVGFRATGGQGSGTTYVISIGQAASYSNIPAPITVGDTGSTVFRGNIGQDLTDIYGSNWSSRTDIQWGIVGSTSSSDIYASRAQVGPTVPAAWTISTSSQRGVVSNGIKNVIGIGIFGGLDDSAATSNSAFASAESTSYQNNWRQYMGPGGTAGSAGSTGNVDFGGPWTSGNGIEGTLSQGLALYHITDSSAGVYEGTFSIAPSGQISFVPEPSSLLTTALGSLLFVGRRRRKA